MVKFSFVVPAFNEEQNLKDLYERILTLMTPHASEWELIFVNDGSFDDSQEILDALADKDKRVKFIQLSRNFGHQIALSAGLEHAQGKAIISMDCDLQDPPEVVNEMIKKWEEGFEIVYARRLNFRKDSYIKKVGSKIYYRLMAKFSDVDIPSNVGDFRLVDRKVQDKINKMGERSRYLRGMVAWAGFKHTFVDYQRPDRKKGESAYTILKLTQLAMSGMINFSFLPLQIGFIMGIISILTGSFVLLFMLGDTLINQVYYHLYKWLIVILFILTGFLFMLLWIIGEYIAKIFNEVRSRPLYIIDYKKNFDDSLER